MEQAPLGAARRLGDGVTPLQDPAAGRAPADAPDPVVVETKLHPPPLRAGLLGRDRLAGRLAEAGLSMVVVCAPAGYGKTTLLAQYVAAAAGRPAAWVSLDEADDDPVVLLVELATALARVAPVDPRVFRSLAGSDRAIERVVLPGLVNCARGGTGDRRSCSTTCTG